MFILIGVLLSNVSCLYQQQAGIHDWNMRLFGELTQIEVSESAIYYQNTQKQNGIIQKSNGQVQSRNDYIKCDQYNYVKYDTNQHLLQLYNEGYTTIAEVELDDEISNCLIGLNGEYIVIYGNSIFSSQSNRLQQKLQHSIIYSGYIFDIPIIITQQIDNKICVNKITNEIIEEYCFNTNGKYKFVQFGKTIIYIDELQAYNLRDNNFEQLNYELLKKTNQFLGFSQTIVIQNQSKQEIVKLNGEKEYEIQNNQYVIENCENQKYYFILGLKEQELIINIYDRDILNQQNNNSIIIQIQNNNQKIKSAFLIDLQKRQFLIQFQDLQSILVDNEIIWSNEQSLIQIDGIFYEKYKTFEQRNKNPYYESLEKYGTQNIQLMPYNFMQRILHEISDFQETLTHYINTIGKETIQTTEMEESYGLKQKIFFLTKYGTLLCYDTQNIKLLKKLIVNIDESYTLIAQHKIETNLIRNLENNDSQETYILFYYSQQKQRLNTFILDLEHDLIQQVASQMSKQIIWSLAYRIENGPGQQNNIVILIDEENKILTYPKYDNLQTKEIILYRNDNGILKGYKLQNKIMEHIWTINITENILNIKSSYHIGEENPRVAIWDDRKVIYKLIDHSNFAILTSDNEKLKLQIINAKTGKILFQSIQGDADFTQPINLLFDEHQVFITYYNRVQMMFEIWTIEIYHAKIEISFLKMLEDYYFNQKQTSINYYRNDFEAIFLQQVYGYPLGIKHISISKTQKSLTKKNLLIITTNGQLHSLDRNLISTRRREKADQQILEYSLQSAELPPYQYQLPLNFLQMLSYYNQFDVNKFSIESTNLESSALLLAYGSDLFFTRISPDKTYDMLSDNFNYIALITTTIIIIIATKFLSKLVKSGKQMKQFHLN